MKLPKGSLDSDLLAPCGMNCTVCYRHCAAKTPCPGCRGSDTEKPAHCRKCAMRDCAAERGIPYCHACPKYPCGRVKRLDRSYRTRYGVSLIENGAYAKEHGLNAFMEWQRSRYACPECGGVVSLHDGTCTECGRRR